MLEEKEEEGGSSGEEEEKEEGGDVGGGGEGGVGGGSDGKGGNHTGSNEAGAFLQEPCVVRRHLPFVCQPITVISAENRSVIRKINKGQAAEGRQWNW